MRWSIRVIVIIFGISLLALVAGHTAAETPATKPTRILLPTVLSDYCGDFYDDFSQSTGWFEGRRDGLVAERQDDEYRLSVTQPGLVWLVGAPDCTRVNNYAAVSGRWAGRTGNFYGLLIGEEGRVGPAHILAVNSDARVWLVLRLEQSNLEIVMGPTQDNIVKAGGGINRLAYLRGGGRIILDINGKAVGQIPDTDPDTPFFVGLVSASYTDRAPADARFDNFVHRGRFVRHAAQADAARSGEARAEPLALPLP